MSESIICTLNIQSDQIIQRIRSLFEAKRWADAEAEVRCLLQSEPDRAFGWRALGAILSNTRRYTEAVEVLKEALRLDPADAESHATLAHILGLAGQFEQAVQLAHRALSLAPDHVEGYLCLAELYLKTGACNKAIAAYRQAIALAPRCADAHAGLLFQLLYEQPEALRVDAERYGAALAAEAVPYVHWTCPATPPLRIGLVSGDFRTHSVSHFLRSVLPRLDVERVCLLAFSTSPETDEDEVTRELRPHFREWHSLYGLTDSDAAQCIHATGVHMAVDLSGHSNGNRLPVFAWKPAPVQVSWCAFATSGLAAMDALLADAASVPPEAEAHFTEKIVRLPTRLCFSPPEALPVAPLPALANGYITFGCVQTLDKIRIPIVRLWAEILRRLPTARLQIRAAALQYAAVRNGFMQTLHACGLDMERVALLGPLPRVAYLNAYAAVDCCLDTFPYTGCTTTCEGLWMGVPTLSLAGNTLVSRQGVSVLQAAGLPGWVAGSPADYVQKAVSLGGSVHALSTLRAALRAQVLASKLMDAGAYARHFCDALEMLWNTGKKT